MQRGDDGRAGDAPRGDAPRTGDARGEDGPRGRAYDGDARAESEAEDDEDDERAESVDDLAEEEGLRNDGEAPVGAATSTVGTLPKFGPAARAMGPATSTLFRQATARGGRPNFPARATDPAFSAPMLPTGIFRLISHAHNWLLVVEGRTERSE